MALRTYQVTVPATVTSLAALLQSLAGWPNMQTLGITYPMPVGRAAQVVLNNDSGNAGNIYVKSGNTNPSGLGATIVPGGSSNLGSATEVAVDLSQIYVQSSTGTQALNIQVVD